MRDPIRILAEASEAYQVLLEGHRAHPDNTELHEDLCKARAEMEVAWLTRGLGGD